MSHCDEPSSSEMPCSKAFEYANRTNRILAKTEKALILVVNQGLNGLGQPPLSDWGKINQP
jgi:hypothetical protein